MADQSTAFLQQPQFLDPEQQQQLNEIARKQRMAQLLTQTGMTPVQGQAVGNRYVAPAWSQYANQLFSAYTGRKTAEEAESMQTKLAQALKTQQASEIEKFNELSKTDPNAAYKFAAQSSNPQLQAIGFKKMLPQELTLKPGERHITVTPTGEQKVVAEVPEKPIVVGNNLVDPATGKVLYTAPKEYNAQVVETTNGFALVDPRTGVVKPLADTSGKPLMGTKGNLPEGANKQVTGATNLKDAVENYKKELQGFKTMDMLNPDARARMGNAYNNMMLQAKEAYNLGVLNGPDYKILTSIVKDPTATSSLLVSKKELENQANQLSNTANTIISNAYKTHNREVPEQFKQPTQTPTASQPIYAVNPQTGQRIVSNDGGKTWSGAK